MVATIDGLQVSGVLERPAVWEVPAGTRLAGARLRPGAAALLGVPADELPPHWLPLSELGRTDPGHDLVEVLARRALLAREDPRTAEAVDLFGRTNGSLAVSVVARRVGVSERTLGRMFRSAVGMPPRTYGRVVRFQAALWMMRGSADLSSVAVQAGYADQAHLTREVAALAGLPPGRLRLVAERQPVPAITERSGTAGNTNTNFAPRSESTSSRLPPLSSAS